jgi:hypothetical protein
MFAKTFHNALALLGLADEPAIESDEQPCATWTADFGCLDLNVPDQAFDALRKVVAIQRAEDARRRTAGNFDLAA